MKKYSVDETFFEKIDGHQKAYFYGLLWADGFLGKNYTTNLQLTKPDNEIIEVLKIEMKSNHITYNYNKTQSVRLTIYSKILWKALGKLNIVPNKTYENLAPIISDEYFWSFLLGLFDGDGSLSGRTLSICNNGATLELIKNKLSKTGVYSTISDTKSIAKCLKISRARDIHFIYENFYKNVNHFFKRKYLKFNDLGFGTNYIKQTSLYKGVCFNKVRKRWEASLYKNNQRIFHKDYSTELEAVIARNNKIKEMFDNKLEISKKFNFIAESIS